MSSKENTFTSFTADQAAAYASGRGSSYPLALYQRIVDYHSPRPRDSVLDVGTGPGKVAFDLCPYFAQCCGCDTSPQMIAQAQKDSARLDLASRTRFAVAGGENCANAFPGEQFDAITVAMAAHWFDMAAFYQSAVRALKPGGTLAMWTCSSTYCHPSVPKHREIQTILHELEDGMLGPYALPGNTMSRNAYERLQMPWDESETKGLFEKESFVREDWDRHGVPSAPIRGDGSPGSFLFGKEETIEQFTTAVSSASMVIRWREANPGKAYTEDDPVHITATRLREVSSGKEELLLAPSLTLLLLRKAA